MQNLFPTEDVFFLFFSLIRIYIPVKFVPSRYSRLNYRWCVELFDCSKGETQSEGEGGITGGSEGEGK